MDHTSTATIPLTRAEALEATAAGFDPPELPRYRHEALQRAAAAIAAAENDHTGGADGHLAAADRWLTLAERLPIRHS